MTDDAISQGLFEDFISKAVENQAESKSIKQLRQFVDQESQEMHQRILSYQLRNNLFRKRVILENCCSVPYGFSKEMLTDAMNE